MKFFSTILPFKEKYITKKWYVDNFLEKEREAVVIYILKECIIIQTY